MKKQIWTLDPTHSEFGFKIKHLMISNVSGSFGKFEVRAETEDNDFTRAQVEVKLDPATIDTNNEQRDAHLRNSDFFEVDKYPEILFQSTRIVPKNSNCFTLWGQLTLRGITKPVELDVEQSGYIGKDPWGLERVGFNVTGKINRNDFGLSFNSILETGGLALGEEVKLYGEIQLIKQAASVAA
ncbi:MAG TPA: YceI family protein [Flavihumibacter sp.]|jgi:polyisoprenoid-binding protein YceI